MDIVAHALWAGAGLVALGRTRAVPQRQLLAGMGLAALPDVMHMLPGVAWWLLGQGSFASVHGYALALPGAEPAAPAMVELWAHHLHCTMHSAIVAALLTLMVWAIWRTFWLPLLGWWSHIVIDVPTHSADFYPSPVLYPLTQRGFDGLAWNTPWFVVMNYVALALVGVWLWRRHVNTAKAVLPPR